MVHQNQVKSSSKPSRFSKDLLSDRFIVTCFVGSMIKRGNKLKALRFFYFLLYSVQRAHGVDSLRFIRLLLETVRPKVFLSSKKIAGVVHKIPTPITVRKSYSIAIHWILASASKRNSSKNFFYNLFDELNDIYKNPSNSTLKKRDEFHRMAYINKPFLRFYKFL